MKKQKIISFVLLVSLALTFFPGVTIQADSNSKMRAIENYANQLIDGDEIFSFVDKISLKSSAGEVEYSFYSMLPRGYVIYNEINNRFEELAPYAIDLPYSKTLERDYYYFGPNCYYYKFGDAFVNCLDETLLSTADLSRFLHTEELKKSIELSSFGSKKIDSINQTTRGVVPIATTYFYYIPNKDYFKTMLGNRFGLNTQGTCTMVACAILLGYYNYYSGNNSYIDSQYCDGCGTTESFHQLMCQYIKPDGGAASFTEAVVGVNNYLDTRNRVNKNAYNVMSGHYAVYDVVKEKIRAGEPVVTAMFNSYNSNCPMNHANVTYGYSMVYTTQTGELDGIYYYVHNGWKNSESNLQTYNYAWFANAIYLN